MRKRRPFLNNDAPARGKQGGPAGVGAQGAHDFAGYVQLSTRVGDYQDFALDLAGVAAGAQQRVGLGASGGFGASGRAGDGYPRGHVFGGIPGKLLLPFRYQQMPARPPVQRQGLGNFQFGEPEYVARGPQLLAGGQLFAHSQVQGPVHAKQARALQAQRLAVADGALQLLQAAPGSAADPSGPTGQQLAQLLPGLLVQQGCGLSSGGGLTTQKIAQVLVKNHRRHSHGARFQL